KREKFPDVEISRGVLALPGLCQEINFGVKASSINSTLPAIGANALWLGAILSLGFGGSDLRAAPANDNFADRIILTGTNISVPGSTLGATQEPNEPPETFGNSVWWSWTAPIAGVCVVEATAADWRPTVGVYVGSSLTAIAPAVNLRADALGRYAFAITPGTTYHIAVGGAENSFDLALRAGP